MDLLSKSSSKGVLGIKKTIIAYSRPRNIRGITQKAKLDQHPGKEVSTFFEGSTYSHVGPFFFNLCNTLVTMRYAVVGVWTNRSNRLALF